MRSQLASGCVLFAAVVIGAACGSDAADRVTGGASSSTVGVPRSAAAKFCAGWPEALTADDEARATALLRDPPRQLAEAAAVIRASEAGHDANTDTDVAATDAAVREVMVWVEVNCNTDSKQRHVAPPAGADLAGLTFCSAGGVLPVPQSDAADEAARNDVVLLGKADRADPYDGPMIGLFSAKEGEGGYAGDGDKTPITVRGKAGVAAPITVFQQTIVPELGTVIAWTEGGRDVGLFGRLWTQEQTGALIALANRLELADGRLVFPAGAQPDGYEQVFAGPNDANWSLITNGIIGDYHVQYQRADGDMLSLAGLQLTVAQFNSFRFFAFPISHIRIGDHDALFGSMWSAHDGPYVATWREPDGFTVRIVSIGSSQEQVRAIAEHSRDLDRAEWVKLVQTANDCPHDHPRELDAPAGVLRGAARFANDWSATASPKALECAQPGRLKV